MQLSPGSRSLIRASPMLHMESQSSHGGLWFEIQPLQFEKQTGLVFACMPKILT